MPMLNREKHQLIMGKMRRDIYSDASIASLLGFKGGTCMYFFYGLPRLSVDLDFDLLDVTEEQKALVFNRIQNILAKYGTVKDSTIKRYTVFALLSYGEADYNVKVEINTRELLPAMKDQYELREYLGISMLTAKKEYLFAGKLSALGGRKETAMRDIYDIYYFTSHDWAYEPETVHALVGKPLKAYLLDCIAIIESVPDNRILDGLGELLDAKQKAWVKAHLKADTIFNLKNYLSVLE